MGRARDGRALQEDVQDRVSATSMATMPGWRKRVAKWRDHHPYEIHTGFNRETGQAVSTRRRRWTSIGPALHRHRGRRDGRPDDGGRQGYRRRDPASRADGARSRHPPHHGDAASRRSMSSPARSRRTSRPGSPSRSPRRSTAGRSSARWAPSSCWARATCCSWPEVAAPPASTARSARIRKSRAWSPTSSVRAGRPISKPSPWTMNPPEDEAGQGLQRPTRRPRPLDRRDRDRRRRSSMPGQPMRAVGSMRGPTSTTRRCRW